MSAAPKPLGNKAPNKQQATDAWELAEHLRHERDRFVAFAFAASDILLEIDADGTVIFADGATKGLLNLSTDELIGSNFYELMEEDQSAEVKSTIRALDRTHRMPRDEVMIFNKHKDPIPFAMSGFRLSTYHKHTYVTLSVVKGQVSTDQLFKRDIDTGLLKTGSFVEQANEKIQAAKESGEEVEVTLVDFPELKGFLDQLSPEDADRLLAEISAYLRGHSMDGDTAGMLNDEAFSFVHEAGQDPGAMIVDLMEITKNFDPKGKGIQVRSKTLETDVGELSAQDSANVLLYTLNEFANSAGENFTIESLSKGYEKLLDDTMHKITEFKRTVDEEAFDLAFQPIVDLKSGLIHHYEVLVRMKNPDTFSNPFEFINFGEKSGVISDFDLVMIQKTFDVLARTAKKGNFPIVAVNLSGRSFGSFLFKDTLRRLIEDNKKYRKQMIFEVTESAKIDDMAAANEFLQELRGGGNLCCLDDFGTGESSFEYLRNLQVDFIKIDGSYVRESLKTQRGRHMLKAMAGLCRDLNVTTIGEMVEDEKAATLLWEAGVKFGQGYLFGKPEVDEETIVNCKKPTAFYGGMMRARKIPEAQKKLWKSDN